ncbi:hypothetical protein KCU88_g154, partial [Aureobasidium melanogenum]
MQPPRRPNAELPLRQIPNAHKTSQDRAKTHPYARPGTHGACGPPSPKNRGSPPPHAGYHGAKSWPPDKRYSRRPNPWPWRRSGATGNAASSDTDCATNNGPNNADTSVGDSVGVNKGLKDKLALISRYTVRDNGLAPKTTVPAPISSSRIPRRRVTEIGRLRPTGLGCAST